MASGISLVGLNKAAVLAALFNASKPQGMGFMQFDPKPMSVETAQQILDEGHTYFDYLQGRVMKIDLSGDDLNPWGYDRDNGQGAVQRVIDGLKKDGDANSVDIQALHDVGTKTAAKDVMDHIHEESVLEIHGGHASATLGLADVAHHLIPKVERFVRED